MTSKGLVGMGVEGAVSVGVSIGATGRRRAVGVGVSVSASGRRRTANVGVNAGTAGPAAAPPAVGGP
ncbi:hypothetical protein DF268_23350 [Streptomyces sp. V2]|nr:hypothetical protein DF268_23350 [Streptomyces sp. V2]